MKIARWGIFAALWCFGIALSAQAEATANTQADFDKQYAWRIRQERLNNVYIPRDLANSFEELNRLTEPASRQKFKSMDETDAVRKLYFSLGRWIIHNWGFYEGSRLSDYLRKLGVYHPEDMAQVVIVSYHRYLNRLPLELKTQVQAVKEKRKLENEERLKKGAVIGVLPKKGTGN
jgi:hypothetical protein